MKKFEIIVDVSHPNNLRLMVGNQVIDLSVREVVELRDGLTKWLEMPTLKTLREADE